MRTSQAQTQALWEKGVYVKTSATARMLLVVALLSQVSALCLSLMRNEWVAAAVLAVGFIGSMNVLCLPIAAMALDFLHDNPVGAALVVAAGVSAWMGFLGTARHLEAHGWGPFTPDATALALAGILKNTDGLHSLTEILDAGYKAPRHISRDEIQLLRLDMLVRNLRGMNSRVVSDRFKEQVEACLLAHLGSGEGVGIANLPTRIKESLMEATVEGRLSKFVSLFAEGGDEFLLNATKLALAPDIQVSAHALSLGRLVPMR